MATQRKQIKSAFIRIISVIYVPILLAWLQVPVFRNGIKTRASLAGFQIPMPHNQGLRVSPMQVFEQTAQGNTLGFRPGAGRLIILGQSQYNTPRWSVGYGSCSVPPLFLRIGQVR